MVMLIVMCEGTLLMTVTSLVDSVPGRLGLDAEGGDGDVDRDV